MLNEHQIALLSAYIKQNGVAQNELHDDLLDHVCTSIENQMEQGSTFEEAFQHTLKLFGPGGLKQVQQETFELLTKMNETMKKVTFGFGLTSTFLLLAGTIFKLMHWPWASILVTLGAGLLVLGYLPLILAHKLKESPKGESLLHITGFVGLALTSVGVLFKIMHWPGAAVMLLGGMGILAFGYVPAYFIKRYKTSVNKPVTLSSSIVTAACLILVFALMKTNNSVSYEHGVALANEQLEASTMQMAALNEVLISRSTLKDAALIKDQADDLVKYLEELKVHLIAESANLSEETAANINLADLESKHDMNTPTTILLGENPGTIRDGAYSATDLQEKLRSYRSFIISFHDEREKEIMEVHLDLNTDRVYINAKNEKQHWAEHHFQFVPLFTVITNLSKWQLEVRQMENQLLLSKISRPVASNPPS